MRIRRLPGLLLHVELGAIFLDRDALVVAQVVGADNEFLHARSVDLYGVLAVGCIDVHADDVLTSGLHRCQLRGISSGSD